MRKKRGTIVWTFIMKRKNERKERGKKKKKSARDEKDLELDLNRYGHKKKRKGGRKNRRLKETARENG